MSCREDLFGGVRMPFSVLLGTPPTNDVPSGLSDFILRSCFSIILLVCSPQGVYLQELWILAKGNQLALPPWRSFFAFLSYRFRRPENITIVIFVKFLTDRYLESSCFQCLTIYLVSIIALVSRNISWRQTPIL